MLIFGDDGVELLDLLGEMLAQQQQKAEVVVHQYRSIGFE